MSPVNGPVIPNSGGAFDVRVPLRVVISDNLPARRVDVPVAK
jgi:hypothetical protein